MYFPDPNWGASSSLELDALHVTHKMGACGS